MSKYFPFIAIVLTVIAVILLWFALKDKVMNFFKKSDSSTGNGTDGGTATAPLNTDLLLKKGMYNSPEVAELQRKLGELKDDGDFGPKTEARLKAVKCVTEIKLKNYDSTVCPIGESPLEGGQPASTPWWYSLPYGYAIFGNN